MDRQGLMQKSDATWGLVATIKAPVGEILDFAAYHAELGAHRLYIYLDEPNTQAYDLLKSHPKVRVFTCDDAHWKKLGVKRPVKHQVRQSLNATHAYGRPPEVDWLAHIDVDEYLWPSVPLDRQLSALPARCTCARVRPIESLAGSQGAFKGFIPAGPQRDIIVKRLYPTFGAYITGGFLSHLAGKLFVRTGLSGVAIRIHNMFVDDTMNPDEEALENTQLCHVHVRSWEQWFKQYRFRHEKGSYRAELAPKPTENKEQMNLHELFKSLEKDRGTDGLRALFDEICADTADHRKMLKAEHLLHVCDLDLITKRRKHFPKFEQTVTN